MAAKTIEMRPARRRSQTKKAAAAPTKARPSEQLPFPRFVNHGRAWINGDEVGGSDPRYAHLDDSYD